MNKESIVLGSGDLYCTEFMGTNAEFSFFFEIDFITPYVSPICNCKKDKTFIIDSWYIMKWAVSDSKSSIFFSPVVYGSRFKNVLSNEANPGRIAAIKLLNSAKFCGLYFLTRLVVASFSH